jgi:hypothetical protein
MFEENGSPAPAMAEVPQNGDILPAAPESKLANASDGSVGSHLLFGLGALLFVSPMLIPGIPLSWLAVAYVGLMGLAIVGYLFWSVFSALKARRQSR